MGFTFDGKAVPSQEGDTIASALHRDGVRVLSRSMKYHRPRGLYCVTGSCAGCLVNVDGVPNVAACMTHAADAQTVRSQNTIGGARRDLLGIVDKVYRNGFDPHDAFTRIRPVNVAFLTAVRMMSGLGRAPRQSSAPTGHRRTRHVGHLVVGAGRHGLAAALDGREDALIVDELPELGGSRLWRDEPETAGLVRRIHDEAVEAWTSAVAFGIYGDTVAVWRGDDLWELTADRITIAPGRHDAWPLFANNDLPGILSVRGAQRLLHQHGVLPGRRIVGHGNLPASFVDAIDAAGGQVVAQGDVTAARGRGQVEAARIGAWVDCDAIVCNLPGTPRAELFQQAGCRLDFALGGLGPARDATGQTSRPGLFAAFSEAP